MDMQTPETDETWTPTAPPFPLTADTSDWRW